MRLEQIQSQLADAQLALDEATRRRDEYRRQLEGVEILFEPEISVPAASSRGRLSHPLDGRIASLESNLDGLLLQYTEKHPDVVSTRAILADLDAQREKELEEMRAEAAAAPAPAPAPAARGGNTVEQELTIALGNAEAKVASLQARVDEYSRREAELRKLVDTVPRIEAELARLNRDYDINRRNYDELVKRRESLKLAEDASQASDSVQFNIIEPPRVPLTPVGPDRPLFSAVVLAAGLGFGVGVAWLIGMMRPALYTKTEIEELFRLPVLGAVTRVWTRREQLQRRLEVATFVVGCVVLMGLFSALIMVELTHDELLQRVRDLDVAERISRLAGGLL